MEGSSIRKDCPERIGILGGTFDPIHMGHLMMAEQAAAFAGLQKVLLMPSGHSYFKDDRSDAVSAPEHRLAMTKLAARLSPVFEAEAIEVCRSGNTYTCETLPLLEEKYPGAELYLIVGADTLLSIRNWKNPEIVFDKCRILAAVRPDQISDEMLVCEMKRLEDEFEAKTELLPIVPNGISSSLIRTLCSEKKSIRFLVPQPVEEYIRANGLYTGKTKEPEALCTDSGPSSAERTDRTGLAADLMFQLPFRRFIHTIGVAYTAELLAGRYGASDEQAFLAGLYHDCAKYLPESEMRGTVLRGGFEINFAEDANPELLHAKAGAVLAKERYGIVDPEIIDAIRYHSTGHPGMSLLEKIIYIADYIEPGRIKAPRLSELRKEAFEDLDAALFHILEDTVKYLQTTGKIIDPMTEETLAYYRAEQLQ